MNLDAVEASLDGVLGGFGVVSDITLDVLLSQRLGSFVSFFDGNVGSRDEFVAETMDNLWHGSASQSPKLGKDETAQAVDTFGNNLPPFNLLVIPKAGRVARRTVC